jgi:hypothetical protein
LGRWLITAEDGDTLEAFRHHFTVPPEDEREHAFGDDRIFGRTFSRMKKQGALRYRMNIRSNRLHNPADGRFVPAPLCRGHLHNYGSKSRGGVMEHAADLRLWLNLLRFLRHQPEEDRKPLNYSTRAKPRFLERGDRSSFGSEVALDGEDNWLPDSRGWRAYASQKRRRAMLDAYLQTMVRRVEGDFKRAAKVLQQMHAGRVDFLRHDYFSVRLVETAWEFASDDPYAEALELGGTLWRHTSDSGEAKLYQHRGGGLAQIAQAGQRKNSLSILVRLASGVKLRLYAKTNKRIRFEVIQEDLQDQFSKLRSEAGLPAMPPRRRGAMQERPLSEMMPLFRAIRERAARHLNDFFRRVAVTESGGRQPKSGLELVAEIGSAVAHVRDESERVKLMQKLMSLIAQQGGWRGNAQSGELARAVATLSRREVLEYRMGKRHYAVTPAYGPAAASLRALTMETLRALCGDTIGGNG